MHCTHRDLVFSAVEIRQVCCPVHLTRMTAPAVTGLGIYNVSEKVSPVSVLFIENCYFYWLAMSRHLKLHYCVFISRSAI